MVVKFEEVSPPRKFRVGFAAESEMSDVGHITLEPDEQVTFLTTGGGEYDVARKAWGFYATPSLNARLAGFGLRGVLVRNRLDRYFVLLVEDGHEDEYQAYLRAEQLVEVARLDSADQLSRVEVARTEEAGRRCMCGDGRFVTRFTYDSPPEGEVRFGFSDASRYHREIARCTLCGHFVSIHDMDMSDLYAGHYVTATYGSGLQETFERIMALPDERSDNAGRVARIVQFAETALPARVFDRQPRLLDVGAGLGVFPARIIQRGWECVAIDPDPQASAHLRNQVGVQTVEGDFLEADLADLGSFDIVTFNKVLEHVRDPVSMLARARPLLKPHGFVYIEVPDGDTASISGAGREEFFIDHHHAFSAASAVLLAERAGFAVIGLERLVEPSEKYTIRAFLRVR
jgi:2-polyprenyl-3-methyl-5-hydroxy-6-metoxy-1,4-benzoquinol methylase